MTTDPPAPPDTHEPGRPVTLGTEIDRADAADLLGVLKIVRAHQDRSGANAYKVAREALWFMWEQRRLPRPLIRGKYPTSYPWSADARASLERHRADGRPDGSFGGVVIEHLIPATLMVQEALALAAELDVDGMIELLSQHGAAAVVTVEDDRRLTSAGLRSTMPAGWDGDVWARPRAAELDPAGFAPISAPTQPGSDLLDRADAGRAPPGRSRDQRRDHTWESYVAEVGHAPSKVELARALADTIERSTRWTPARTANQVVFRDQGERVLAIQLWVVDGVRIEALRLTEPPPPGLLGSIPARQTVRGTWYWALSADNDRPDIGGLIELLERRR
jgi:hypothetical protein